MQERRIHALVWALLAAAVGCGDEGPTPPVTHQPACIDYATQPGLQGFVDVRAANSIAAADGRLVVASSLSWLTFVDATDPANPSVTAVLPEAAEDVRIRDGFAFVTTPDERLLAIEMRDPTAPRIASSFDVPSNGRPRNLEVENGRAFVVIMTNTVETWLRCVDVSNPAQPSLVWTAVLPDRVVDVVANDARVFVLSLDAGLRILDATTGTTLGPDLDIPEARYVAIGPETAYVLTPRGDLHVVDVRNPEAPTVVGNLVVGMFGERRGWMRGFHATQEHLYVMTSTHVHALSITADPRAPVETARLPIAGWGNAAVVGSRVYFAQFGGVQVYDFKDFEFAAPMAQHPVDTRIRHVEWSNNHIVTFGSRVETFYVANERMSARGSTLELTTTGAVAMWRGLAHVVSGSYLRVVDTRTPARLHEIGAVDLGVSAWSLFGTEVRDGIVYVVVDGLMVVDARDPSWPRIHGRVELPSLGRDVALGAEHAFVVGDDGMTILDLSDPFTPVVLGEADVPGHTTVFLRDHLIVLDHDDRLRVIDVSHPTMPTPVAELQMHRYSDEIVVDDPWVYVLEGEIVRLLDFTDPTQAHFIGQLNTDYATRLMQRTPNGLLTSTHETMRLYPSHCR